MPVLQYTKEWRGRWSVTWDKQAEWVSDLERELVEASVASWNGGDPHPTQIANVVQRFFERHGVTIDPTPCRYTNCHATATTTVHGTDLCNEHATEYREMLSMRSIGA